MFSRYPNGYAVGSSGYTLLTQLTWNQLVFQSVEQPITLLGVNFNIFKYRDGQLELPGTDSNKLLMQAPPGLHKQDGTN